MEKDCIIKTEGVSRVFKSGGETVRALNKVSIQIPRASLTIFRGRSGSGKTTLLNLLSGLDSPTEGMVYFEGKKLSSMGEGARDRLRGKKMGFVFQSIALMPDMTAVENIEYGLRISGGYAKAGRERIEECLRMVGLEKRMGHLTAQLSGGEQQRVAIARGFAHRPAIMFADEPTAELDTAMGVQVVNVFKKLISEEKLTVVMTTHDPNMMEIADLVYTLADGVIADGDD